MSFLSIYLISGNIAQYREGHLNLKETMPKIDNYYEIREKDLNWAPIKLTEIGEHSNKIQVLKNNEQIEVKNINFREISISKIHLERIGFANNSFNNIFVFPIYMIFGEELMNLTSAYFGHIIFHKDELVSVQNKFNSVRLEIYETYKTNPEIIFDKENVIKDKFNSIFSVNQLFEKLEEYNIIIENKNEILIG